MYYKSELLRNRFVMIRGRFSGGLPEAFFGIVLLDLFGTDLGMNFGFAFFRCFFSGLGPKGLGPRAQNESFRIDPNGHVARLK